MKLFLVLAWCLLAGAFYLAFVQPADTGESATLAQIGLLVAGVVAAGLAAWRFFSNGRD